MPNHPKSTKYSSLCLKDVVCLCAGPCDEEAWQEFVSRVGKPLSLTVLRTAAMWGDASRSLVEDLIQQTYLKLWERGRTLLCDFALQQPEAILGYLKRIAANVTHDHFKHRHSQTSGGGSPHVSTVDIEPEAGEEVDGSERKMALAIVLNQIDERLKVSLTGPDQERDRMIFWLYFKQGMSTKEIATLPAIGLGAKGVGSVIERVKLLIREQILAHQVPPDDILNEAEKEVLR